MPCEYHHTTENISCFVRSLHHERHVLPGFAPMIQTKLQWRIGRQMDQSNKNCGQKIRTGIKTRWALAWQVPRWDCRGRILRPVGMMVIASNVLVFVS